MSRSVLIGVLILKLQTLLGNSRLITDIQTVQNNHNDFSFVSLSAEQDSLPNKISRIQTVPNFLAETSALCETKDGIWSINDSHNPSELILLKREAYSNWRDNGIPLLENHFVIFDLAYENHDWEALETDGHYLYIGDFGNNKGNRKNLRIIKISIDSLRRRMNESGGKAAYKLPENDGIAQIYSNNNKQVLRINCKNVAGEIISFNYSNQKEFSARRLHNFDCEAMVVRKNSILLLSKNWKNLKCNIYELPKNAGNYTLKKSGSFNPKFLITDATEADGKIFFCGYERSGKQYIGSISNSDYGQCERKKIALKPAQIEGIHFDKTSKQFLLSTEARKTQLQALVLIKN